MAYAFKPSQIHFREALDAEAVRGFEIAWVAGEKGFRHGGVGIADVKAQTAPVIPRPYP